jgi:serine protease
VQSSANWLSAGPLNTSADGLGTWRITADRTSLDPGNYEGTLTFKSTAGDAIVRVSLRSGDGSNGDIGTVYILFIDHDTQEVIDQAVTRADQNYQFTRPNLPEGDYEIWAGTDNDNDFFICDDGETCGAYQTMDEPIVLEVRQDQTGINFSSDYQISLRTASSNLNTSASIAAKNPPKTGLRRIRRPQQRD